jgi:DNA-nicking Smr family endonuclease
MLPYKVIGFLRLHYLRNNQAQKALNSVLTEASQFNYDFGLI